ncbi:MAG: OmpA family protein [Proteobacteria bacterium]|nr:OmpA family protein [Pseudomonadota bacterium]
MTNKTYSVIKIGFGMFIPFLLIFAGCGPSQQEMMARDHLQNAKAAYAQARANPDVEANAQLPLMDAGRAIDAAAQATEFDEMDHLAYLALKKTQIAVATAEEKMAEKDKEVLSKETERLILQERERGQLAKMEARMATADARESRAESEALSKEAQQANAEAGAQAQKAQLAKIEARTATVEAMESRTEARAQAQEAEKATAEADRLQKEIAAMKGKMTARGVVLTIGDVLFTTGTATLSPKADSEISRLSDFMKKYPARNVLIEGYTDSTGKEGTNLDLSLKRADAVKEKLVAQGISEGRITTRGFGEESPVTSNDTAAGREQNRRVEVVILNEGIDAEPRFRP